MKQINNKVTIKGATVLDYKTETIEGPLTTFPLTKTPEGTEVRQTNSAGALFTRGQKNIGTIGTDFDYYVEPDQKTFTFSGSKSNIWIQYGAQVPMPIVLTNSTSIAKYDSATGKPHHKKFTCFDIKDIADAEQRGRKILAKYSTPFNEALEVPIINSIIEDNGFIKPGYLISIVDSFTNKNLTAFVKMVKKSFHHIYDLVTIGD